MPCSRPSMSTRPLLFAVARGGPKATGHLQWVENAVARPPGALIARLMQGIVVAVA